MSTFSESSFVKDEIYVRLEKIAREELHADIPYDWTFCWHDALSIGNFFTRPDGMDLCELLYRIEEEFRIVISDEEAERIRDVQQTVDLIYDKVRSKSLT